MKISVVIPAYNAEKTVGRAIDSVLAQTRSADEVFVIDDGSSDRTADVIRAYGDKVTLIQQKNAGVSVARNTGIEAASGDWIAFLDSDDEWLPEKLKCQAEHLRRNPDLVWTFANFFERQGRPEHAEAMVSPKTAALLAGGEIFDDYLEAFVNQTYAWTGTVMVRRDVFETVGAFKPGMKRAQDNDLWYRIAYQFPKIGYLSQPLAIYHLDTPGSSTKINDDVDFMIDLVRRHQGLSEQYGRQKAFAPCRTQMLTGWMRQLLTQKRFREIRRLMETFGEDLPRRFKNEMRFRLLWPPLTMPAAEGMLRFKKRLASGKTQ